MHLYTKAGKPHNSLKAQTSQQCREPELTRGGQAISRLRPTWSASVCNVVASLANLGQEASNHAR